MDYQKLIFKAIEYIEKNLFDSTLVTDVYTFSFVSRFHFHRMFYIVIKLTVGQYIKKRRFTEISKLLLTTDETLLNIAVYAGYNSHEAFTRAFKQYFGVTPSSYREVHDKQVFLLLEPYSFEAIAFSYNQINAPEIINKKSFSLYGVRSTSSLDTPSIERLWHAFRTKANLTGKGEGYTVWLDSTSPVKNLKEETPYGCFVGVESYLPLDELKIPEGLYAIFNMEGNINNLHQMYLYIYFDWFRKSDYELGNEMILELYSKDFDYLNQEGKMSILVPIKKSNNYQINISF